MKKSWIKISDLVYKDLERVWSEKLKISWKKQGGEKKRRRKYLVKELRESFVIRDHDGTVIILEASMNYTATSALPQSAYP